MDDKTIIDLLWSRSEVGIEQMKNKYGRLCGSIICHILPDMRDVEECISDTYIRIWNTIPPELPRSLRGYLARIARNVALDRYAHNHAQMRDSALTISYEELEPCIAYADNIYSENLLRELINGFLRKQPKERRIMFVRRYFYGESNKQIADYFGYSEEKVRVTLFRMRNQLRKILQKEGVQL
jgi:RNA polymerase sigma-70 factor (ECF subfamily)